MARFYDQENTREQYRMRKKLLNPLRPRKILFSRPKVRECGSEFKSIFKFWGKKLLWKLLKDGKIRWIDDITAMSTFHRTARALKYTRIFHRRYFLKE